jgi:hypothetical protein
MRTGQRVMATLRVVILVDLAIVLVSALLLAAGVPVGSQPYPWPFEPGPALDLALTVLLVPLVEELVFHALPSWTADRVTGVKGGPRWGLGVVLAVVFALAHTLVAEPTIRSLALAPDVHVSFERLPLPQVAFGLLFWHLMRRHGFGYACLGHALTNGLLALTLATSS